MECGLALIRFVLYSPTKRERKPHRKRKRLVKEDGKKVIERNYEITGDIKGKEIIIIDDVLTTGQSVSDYKEEIERHGGKVVAAISMERRFPCRRCPSSGCRYGATVSAMQSKGEKVIVRPVPKHIPAVLS